MRRWAQLLAVAGLAGWALGSLGQASAPAGAAIPADVASAVHDLGDDQFAVRQAASKRLLEIGLSAMPALHEAMQSSDPEVAARAGQLIDELKVGITADTPEEVAKILRPFTTDDLRARLAVVEQLGAMGEKALPNLLTLAEYETDPKLLAAVQAKLFNDPHATIRLMLLRGDTARLDSFLEVGCRSGKATVIAEWAVYTVLQKRYDETCRKLKTRAAGLNAGAAERATIERQLVYLHRAAGDEAGAMKAALLTGDPTLEYGMFAECGDWKGLTAFKGEPKLDVLWKYQPIAARALGAYFAGDMPKYEAGLQAMRQSAANEGEHGNSAEMDGRYPEILCFLNRPDEAVAERIKAGWWSSAMELQVARGCYDAATELAERAKKEKPPDLSAVLAKQALMLIALGETESAEKLVDQLEGKIGAEADAAKTPAPNRHEDAVWQLNAMVFDLVTARRELHEPDKAWAAAGKLLEAFPPSNSTNVPAIFYRMFSGREDDAYLYTVELREIRPNRSMADDLKTVAAILNRKMKADELEPLMKEIYAQVQKPVQGGHNDADQKTRRQNWGQRILGDLQAAGVHGAFVDQLSHELPNEKEKWKQVKETQDRGRQAAQAGNWMAAAANYGALARLDGDDWPLYLEGYALERAGLHQPGQALRQGAHMLMLGSASEHYDLAEEAETLGLGDMAAAEYGWVMRCDEPLAIYWQNAAQSLAFNGALGPVRSAEYLRAFNLAFIGDRGAFASERPDIELFLAKKQHDLAARAAAAQQHWKQVVAELNAGLLLYPGDIDIMIETIPKLDAAGQQEQADAVVAGQVHYFESVLAKYPRAANEHNGLAWLCAKTHRDLDVALAHAKKATEYFPKSAGFLDTLAEVHFARGEFAAAVAVEKTAITIEPKWTLLREQLARFEAPPGANKPQ